MSTSIASVSAARSVAAAHPDSSIPCPLCGVDLKAANLQKHLNKVHDVIDSGRFSGTDGSWAGVDRRMRALVFLPFVVFGIGMPFVMGLGPENDRTALIALTSLALVTGLPAVFAYLGKFRGSASVDDGGLTLRWTLGRSCATFPLELETGSLLHRQESVLVQTRGEWNPQTYDEKVGAYVAFTGANGKRIVLGATRSPRVARYWSSKRHRPGPARRVWDIELEPVALTQLLYLLAARGELVFRAED